MAVAVKHRIGEWLIPRLPVTRHVFNHIRWEVNGLWVRLNHEVNPFYRARRARLNGKRELSVDVAAGPFGKPGWLNLDLMAMPNLWLRYDCRKGLPFREGSVARVRCEHFFEHLDPAEEAPAFLRSCHCCLREGGVLRIIVPDAGRFLRAYQSGRKEDWSELGWDLENLPAGFRTQMDVINHVFRQCEEHRYAYDFETLANALRDAGFEAVRESRFGVSVDPELYDDRPNHRPYSLYVEAIKLPC